MSPSSRRQFLRRSATLGLAATVAPCLCLSATAALASKPNIILFMADDVCYDNFSCYGSEYFETPRLDALAETGIKFNHCYSEPVCTPSRVKIMTGRDSNEPPPAMTFSVPATKPVTNSSREVMTSSGIIRLLGLPGGGQWWHGR